MKAHIGVESRTTVSHAVTATAPNVRDSQVLPKLLHGQETRISGEAAYSGHRDVISSTLPMPRGLFKTQRHRPLSEEGRAKNRTKSKVRANIEHAFWVSK